MDARVNVAQWKIEAVAVTSFTAQFTKKWVKGSLKILRLQWMFFRRITKALKSFLLVKSTQSKVEALQ